MQHYGVVAKENHGDNIVGLYGVLLDIIKLNYLKKIDAFYM